jgi:hypothetical protein
VGEVVEGIGTVKGEGDAEGGGMAGDGEVLEATFVVESPELIVSLFSMLGC